MELPSCSQKRTSTRSSCSRSALAGTNISRPYSAISRPYSAEQPAPPRDSRHARKYSTRRSNTRWCLSPIVVDPSPDVDTGHPQSMVHVQRRSNAAGPSPRAACPLERATPPRHVSCFSRVAAPNGGGIHGVATSVIATVRWLRFFASPVNTPLAFHEVNHEPLPSRAHCLWPLGGRRARRAARDRLGRRVDGPGQPVQPVLWEEPGEV